MCSARGYGSLLIKLKEGFRDARDDGFVTDVQKSGTRVPTSTILRITGEPGKRT